jgi:hypothetical protein
LAESEKEKKYDLAAIIDGNIHPCTIGGDASKIVYFWHHFDVTFDSVNRKWNEQKNVSDQQLPVSTFSDDYDVKG